MKLKCIFNKHDWVKGQGGSYVAFGAMVVHFTKRCKHCFKREVKTKRKLLSSEYRDFITD